MRQASLICAVSLCATMSLGAAGLSEVDRQHLIAHMDMTSHWFIDEVSGLTQAQLDFRRDADTWTIMEVIEHLVLVGPIYWDDLQNALKQPAVEQDLSSHDAAILWYGINRAFRDPAIPSERPKGQLRDLHAGLDTYRKQHAQLLEYVKTTKDDLRSHFVNRQRSDAYQWVLLISTHEQRHILQIREIKADSKFPRK
jgi:DinB family protein